MSRVCGSKQQFSTHSCGRERDEKKAISNCVICLRTSPNWISDKKEIGQMYELYEIDERKEIK